MFYPKIALTNLAKNKKTYVPYLVTCVLAVMMFYVMNAISNNKGLSALPGSASLRMILNWTLIVTGVFVTIFLFYTNSFLVKQRKKEFGLFQVLGMDKQNLAKMMVWETVYTCMVGLGGGLLLGILFGKLMFLLLLKIIRFEVPMKFAIEKEALLVTAILFIVVFVAMLLFNLLQIQRANPIELLYGGVQGEKEPKTKWILAVVGVLATGFGYYIAQTTDSPLTAIGRFFGAVILVVIGTYALFSAGSIALLKSLKKNKKFYYKSKHFSAVSGMIYRMKQNAVGLANICIMSTVVLVLISVSGSLYMGMEDIMATRFPLDFRVNIYEPDQENLAKAEQIVTEELQQEGIEKSDEITYRYGTFAAMLQKEAGHVLLDVQDSDLAYATENYRELQCIPLEDYNRMENKKLSLSAGEVLVYTPAESYELSTITLQDETYQVKQVLEEMKIQKSNKSSVVKAMYVITPDANMITELLTKYDVEGNPNLIFEKLFNLNGDKEKTESAMKTITDRLSAEIQSSRVEYRSAYSQEFYALYGGFLFLGVFVGTLFLMATVLIIYYKQISEGYEDRKRYQIMQKVGMSNIEVKKSIQCQVWLVFFLPIIIAVIHVAMAFKVITKLLAVLNLVNVPLFFLCVVVASLVFTMFYALVFVLTSKEYYKIVQA